MMNTPGQGCGTILLADDGSPHARSAAILVSKLPLPPNCRVTVMRVFSSQQATELGRIEKSVEQTCAILKEKGLQVDCEVLLGSPAQMITEYTHQHEIKLIVVGAKGLRATFGILLGGVAQQVVEYSTCPVLVVRTPTTVIQRVLLVTDGSASSQRAMEFLGEFPLPAQVDVRVMHVLPPPPLPPMVYTSTGEPMVLDSALPSEAIKTEQEQEESAGKELLAAVVNTLKGYGIPAEPVLQRGDAATQIIEYVKEQKIDLIVSGSRGLSQIRSWLMGSVSRKLVHYSDCSVLVVRAPRAE
jgi:nucleotide-binding universal stress UspA family protein